MRLICPNCATQYEVADSDIPVAGRVVQCGICENEWTAMRPLKLTTPAAAPAPVVEEPGFDAIGTPADGTSDDFSSAISQALGGRLSDDDLSATTDATFDADDGSYADDDRLSIDDGPEDEEEDANVSDFDAEALRSLLARRVEPQDDVPADEGDLHEGDSIADDVRAEHIAPRDDDARPADAQDEPEHPDTSSGDGQPDDELSSTIAGALGTAAATEPALTPETSENDAAQRGPAAEVVQESPATAAAVADFSIPPVPRDDAVRASADAAFEAMRARRAERRARRSGREDASSEAVDTPLVETTAAPADTADAADAVLDDLRRLLDDEDEAQNDRIAATERPDDDPTDADATLDVQEASPAVSLSGAPQRPARPGRPGTTPAAADTAVEPALAAPRAIRPTRPGRTAPTEPEAKTAPANTSVAPAASGSRFGVGFATAIMLAAIVAGVYFLAGDLATALPPAAPALDSFVGLVDSLRAAISATVSGG